MLQTVYQSKKANIIPMFDFPGDIILLEVKVRIDPYTKKGKMLYRDMDGQKTLAYYEFRWAEDESITAGDMNFHYSFNVRIQGFLARNAKEAMYLWYRYVRLLAGGATVDEALDICADGHDLVAGI